LRSLQKKRHANNNSDSKGSDGDGQGGVVNEEKLQIVVGAAMPVGLNRKADNHGAFLYLSIEHDFF
jgi:hypothetical protein